MDVRDGYYYTKEHEWINIEEGVGTVGISEYAQHSLGDITYVELPTVGAEMDQFEQLASVESVKAASDIFCPLSGQVLEVNSELEDDPGMINKNCYESGWIAKISIAAEEELSNLMSADDYLNFLGALD